MALPNPLPDSPLKWDGWRSYDSSNPYERLCLEPDSEPSEEQIQENYRLLLVWWQKKLPLKNQPSNPMAQLLRTGMDEAPQKLAEASATLLDREARAELDASLRKRAREHAETELRKLLNFTLTSGTLDPDEEHNLQTAGFALGLTAEEIADLINRELESTGAQRVAEKAPPAAPPVGGSSAPAQGSPLSPRDEFMRLLRLSGIDEITDDQRDAFCNMGEALGLTGGEAEDAIDDYLDEQMLGGLAPSTAPLEPLPPGSSSAKPAVHAPLKLVPDTPTGSAGRPSPAASEPIPAPPTPPSVTTTIRRHTAVEHHSSSAARLAQERKAHANFTSSIGVPMLWVPSGSFLMGSDTPDATPLERPVTPTNISGFYMSRWPVTTAQYETFAPQHKTRRAPWADDRHPVIYVSALDAARFCEWLSAKEGRRYRLPTEAEWEYAAKGGGHRTFPWGESLPGAELANFADSNTPFPWAEREVNCGFAQTAPVGSFPRGASPFGVEDMAGNVSEWCLDGISTYSGRERSNPRGPLDGPKRVYRGGSWRSRMTSLRTSARSFNTPGYTANDIGFRIICEATA